MGIFKKQSYNHPFARGIQGAPGVGFSLTADGNYDMIGKKLTNVGDGTDPSDAVTRKQLDNAGVGDITADINLKNSYKRTFNQLKADTESLVSHEEVKENFIGINEAEAMKTYLDMGDNFIYNVKTPTANDQASNNSYVDTTATNTINAAALIHATKAEVNDYLKKDGTTPMTGNLNMNRKRIFNLPAPTGGNQPTPLAFTDLKYLARNGTTPMLNNLNMDNKTIINLKPPTAPTDAANKKYVDDNTTAPDLSPYLKKDGTIPMTGDLNVVGHKIINFKTPTLDSDATTKEYVDSQLHVSQFQPSHYKNQFSYLMSSSNQWTDEIDGGNSFNITKIDNLPPSKGNFHDYNHKVLYTTIIKNSQGGYKYKMGINVYRLTANADYTLCLEILNTDYQLWHKSQISVDKGTSQGLTIGNVGVRKFSHRYSDSKGQTQFMYYHRIIVNFKKLSSGNRFFLHILVNIPQDGTDLAVYPRRFSGVYIITYGIMGTFSNIDPDKVYDYHTAFDIKPTEVVYNVDINANQKEIKNIKLDRQNDNSAATVALVKEVAPFTKNALYRLYFSEVYDFANADSYGINIGSSGVIINSVKPNITLPPNKDLDEIKKDGLNVNGYDVTFSPTHSSKSTLCIVFTHWRNRSFTLTKYLSTNNNILVKLNYDKTNNKVTLTINRATQNFTMLSEFNGKIIVLWLTENFDSNVTKVKISNYSATLTIPAVQYNVNQRWKFTTEDGVLNKLMYSPNFYDFDSEQFHKVMLQEKLNGSYIL